MACKTSNRQLHLAHGLTLKVLAVASVLLALSTPAWAGWDEGVAACKRGDYAAALREWRPLAARASGLRQEAKTEAPSPQPAAPMKPRRPRVSATGSGFYVSAQGHILTNAHVVNGCAEVRIPPSISTSVISQDKANDLALLKGLTGRAVAPVKFHDGRDVQAGDHVMVLGYPSRDILASKAKVTSGFVSAPAGPRRRGHGRRLFRITAPVQPGNSGGPVLDMASNAVGVVVGRLKVIRNARATGDIPQNLNFAISADTARKFLDAHEVPYETAPWTANLSPADVAAKAQEFTVLLECLK